METGFSNNNNSIHTKCGGCCLHNKKMTSAQRYILCGILLETMLLKWHEINSYKTLLQWNICSNVFNICPAFKVNRSVVLSRNALCVRCVHTPNTHQGILYFHLYLWSFSQSHPSSPCSAKLFTRVIIIQKQKSQFCCHTLDQWWPTWF